MPNLTKLNLCNLYSKTGWNFSITLDSFGKLNLPNLKSLWLRNFLRLNNSDCNKLTQINKITRIDLKNLIDLTLDRNYSSNFELSSFKMNNDKKFATIFYQMATITFPN